MSPDDLSGKTCAVANTLTRNPDEDTLTRKTDKGRDTEEATSITDSQASSESSEASESSESMEEVQMFQKKTERKESFGSHTSRTMLSSFSSDEHHISSISSNSGSEDEDYEEDYDGGEVEDNPRGIGAIKFQRDKAQFSSNIEGVEDDTATTPAEFSIRNVRTSRSTEEVNDNDEEHQDEKARLSNVESLRENSENFQWSGEKSKEIEHKFRGGDDPGKLSGKPDRLQVDDHGEKGSGSPKHQDMKHKGKAGDDHATNTYEARKSSPVLEEANDRKCISFEGTQENEGTQEKEAALSSNEELQVVVFDPSLLTTPSSSSHHHRRPSASRSELSSTSQHLGPFTQLDLEEQERQRHEVDTAVEILEHMRRANLVMEFGPGVNFDACVFCLREARKQNLATGMSTYKATAKHKKKSPFHNVLPKWKLIQKECLICRTPLCKRHWDSSFLHQQNVILCQDCAPLFDLDKLVECMNWTNHTNASNRTAIEKEAQKERHMRQLLNVYDRALLALRRSSQSFDHQEARRQILKTHWQKEGLAIGSCVTNIASGLTGLAATAVFMTPMGYGLIVTSLALGGVATAIGSGSFLLERLCPQTRQAEQTIALASMVDSLLEATAILRQARISGALPAACLDESETSEKDDDGYDEDASIHNRSFGQLPMLLASSNAEAGSSENENLSIYLQEDKEQRLMVTILKAKIDAETRAINPLQKFMKNIQNKARTNKASKRKERKKRHRRFTTDDRLDKMIDECDQEQQQGPLKRAARLFKRQANRARQKGGEAMVVAKTATVLTAVGMSAGSSSMPHRLSKRNEGIAKFSSSSQQSDPSGTFNCMPAPDGSNIVESGPQRQENRSSQNDADVAPNGLQLVAYNLFRVRRRRRNENGNGDENDALSGTVAKADSLLVAPQNTTQTIKFTFKDILTGLFLRSNGDDPGEDINSLNERAQVAKIHQKNVDLKLKATGRTLKAFTRTNLKVVGDVSRRQRLLVDEFDADLPPSQMDPLFVKNARFVVKASLTVLRETARYAGGGFSAAIVCLETVELKEKVRRIIRGKGTGCPHAEKLEHLKHHLWANQSSFPDTTMLEWDLSADSKGRSVVNGGRDEKKNSLMIPHWSSSFEGERPDGSRPSNIPIMEGSSSKDLITPYQLY